MRLSELCVIMMSLCSLYTGIYSVVGKAVKINELNHIEQKKLNSLEYISESFRKTCEGKGYSSLNDWQKSCKSLWNLDYIAWCDVSDFMEVKNNSDTVLFYAQWSGENGNGEVYHRGRKNDK